MWKALLPFALLMLAGCMSEPIIAWGTPAGVAYWYDPIYASVGGPGKGQAAYLAQQWCAQYKRDARYNTERMQSSGANEVIFDCVSRPE